MQLVAPVMHEQDTHALCLDQPGRIYPWNRPLPFQVPDMPAAAVSCRRAEHLRRDHCCVGVGLGNGQNNLEGERKERSDVSNGNEHSPRSARRNLTEAANNQNGGLFFGHFGSGLRVVRGLAGKSGRQKNLRRKIGKKGWKLIVLGQKKRPPNQ